MTVLNVGQGVVILAIGSTFLLGKLEYFQEEEEGIAQFPLRINRTRTLSDIVLPPTDDDDRTTRLPPRHYLVKFTDSCDKR